ncbi:PRC-barrel domain-containing protein [Pseudohoeflea coraliihabitans]|uniref:PRC-barrel domain-containing protein n=1 Tax=Pseudohoeflea coraliihabitans TaxID=2860393 RepID=A0ABS6WKT5_9HYPH|nr:PRC-barrel domain-containing protein [Pseudohoeflea sp. DP4N28-3]MBW3095714.1 PRC-barrel domain-containing protein [Pseudohoeflea sp. DP4N28-3]
MNNAIVKTAFRHVAATVFVAGSVLAAASSVNAFQLENVVKGPRTAPATVMAYADPNFDARFGSAPAGEESADHELNDAWLGMTVTAENGENLGYVVDALIDEDGYITDLVITDDPNSEVEIYVPARLATLTDTNVTLALDGNDVAALRTAYNSVLASAN